ncbi:hypothetical protein VT06_08075 [Arsukibacterium sp. MJ3]|nr:hypothetical protein VT06_08075 [Arsukibacterium sp. MJ3]
MNKRGWFAPGHPAQLVIGFTIWSIWFIAMYAGLSVACQLAPPAEQQGALTWLNGALFGLTLLVVTLLLWLARRSGRYCISLAAQANDNQGNSKLNANAKGGVRRFIGFGSTMLYLIAAAATLAGGLPMLVFTPCS